MSAKGFVIDAKMDVKLGIPPIFVPPNWLYFGLALLLTISTGVWFFKGAVNLALLSLGLLVVWGFLGGCLRSYSMFFQYRGHRATQLVVTGLFYTERVLTKMLELHDAGDEEGYKLTKETRSHITAL